MAQRQREREEKFDVGPEFVLPDLVDLAPAGCRIEHVQAHLDSLYFDTAGRDLLRNRVTLRRRAGDTDTGWQLKVPAGKARSELRLPPTDPEPSAQPTGDETPPRELADLVRGVAGEDGLEPAARIRTEREIHRMVTEEGSTVVEVADDHVRADAFGDAAIASEWREVEVELGSGNETLLATIGRRLARAGAHPSPSASKLARALRPTAESSPEKPAATAAAVLSAYIGRQHAAIVSGDVALRRDEDVIHPTRVATRRLRSTLRTFSPMFDPERAQALDTELRWYAGLLGEVRDRQVQRRRFAAAIAALPPERVLGPVAADVEDWLLAEEAEHWLALSRALVSDRYRALLAEVARWGNEPPFAPVAHGSPKAVRRLARQARRRSAKRLDAALRAVDAANAANAANVSGDGDGAGTPEVDAALHRARKAAKRARYAAELTRPIGKKSKAKKLVKRYKTIQDLLGDHQDSVVAAEVFAGFGARAGTRAGHNGFTYGLLYGREEAAAERIRREAVRRYR